MQYTVRDIPKSVDRALRARAKSQGKSLNQVTVETLQEALGVETPPKKIHADLDWFIGTWVEDPAFEKIISEQDQVNPDDWK